jgi:hypothetical protein
MPNVAYFLVSNNSTEFYGTVIYKNVFALHSLGATYCPVRLTKLLFLPPILFVHDRLDALW